MAKQRIISVIGLGYVGLPVAVAMAKKFEVIGYDIRQSRIDELKAGHDSTNEVEATDLKAAKLTLTHDATQLRKANFHIVTVPTPIDLAHQPDLAAIRSATMALGSILKSGDIVV